MDTSLFMATILGANALIVPFGKKSGANTIGELVAPTPPTAEAPGDWIKLGKIKTATPQFEYKTLDVEGVNEAGIYETEELRLATKRKFQFVTNTVTKEALQLTFGLPAVIVDGTPQVPFSSSADEITCWIYYRLRDSYHEGKEMAHLMFAAKLRLTKPVSMSAEAASVEWEANIIQSVLNDFESLAINKPASA